MNQEITNDNASYDNNMARLLVLRCSLFFTRTSFCASSPGLLEAGCFSLENPRLAAGRSENLRWPDQALGPGFGDTWSRQWV